MEFKTIPLSNADQCRSVIIADHCRGHLDNVPPNIESLYRAINIRLNTVYECMRLPKFTGPARGVWECVVTNFDAQNDEARKEQSPNFNTLRECKQWAERQDYVRMEAAFPTPRHPIHQTHLDLIDAINAYIEAKRDHVVECLERDIESDGARDAIFSQLVHIAPPAPEIKIPKDPTALNHHDEHAGMGIAQGLTEKISRNIRASIALQYLNAYRESFQKH